jgi:hypothetical protein
MFPVLDTHMMNWSNDLKLREANLKRILGNFRDMNMIPGFNTFLICGSLIHSGLSFTLICVPSGLLLLLYCNFLVYLFIKLVDGLKL